MSDVHASWVPVKYFFVLDPPPPLNRSMIVQSICLPIAYIDIEGTHCRAARDPVGYAIQRQGIGIKDTQVERLHEG